MEERVNSKPYPGEMPETRDEAGHLDKDNLGDEVGVDETIFQSTGFLVTTLLVTDFWKMNLVTDFCNDKSYHGSSVRFTRLVLHLFLPPLTKCSLPKIT